MLAIFLLNLIEIDLIDGRGGGGCVGRDDGGCGEWKNLLLGLEVCTIPG